MKKSYHNILNVMIFWMFIIIMKLILVIGLLLVSTFAVYTSRHFEKKGMNVKDGLNTDVKFMDIQTICNDVVLNQNPYLYNGISLTLFRNCQKWIS